MRQLSAKPMGQNILRPRRDHHSHRLWTEPYLFAHTGGHVGSLITLINRTCFKATRTGTETLIREMLDTVRIDKTAEKARRAAMPRSHGAAS